MSIRNYRDLLAAPGVGALVTSSLLARMPGSMAVIALSFWARDATGTFAWSGALVGAYSVGTAVVGPLLGRWADRVGARRVLAPAGMAFVSGFAVLAWLPVSVWWLGLGVAALTGAALPPVGATLRAAWPRLVRGERLRLAFTLEATVQELMFAVGPMVAAVVVSYAGSRAAVLGCGVVAAAGTAWFVTRPALRDSGGTRDGSATGGRVGRVLADPGRFGLVAGMALLVASFSAAELGMVAFAEHAGDRTLSGVLEMVWSLGSFAGGVVAGAVATRRSAVAWHRVAVISAGFVGCVFAPGVWWLGLALMLAGAMIAPSMAAVMERMGELAPARSRTEAFAWLSTAGMAGAGFGAVLAGRSVEAYGASAGFTLAAALCALAALVLLPARGTAVPDTEPEPVPARVRD